MNNGDAPTGRKYTRTLVSRLGPVADQLRGLAGKFGLRPYTVTLVHTYWSGGKRGVGEEIIAHEHLLDPVPKITDLTGVQSIVSPAGLVEQGEVMLTGISPSMREEVLRGVECDGHPTPLDQQFFYEVQFPLPDGQPGERRRFVTASAPYYSPGKLQWQVQLRKQVEGRQRNGDMR